MKMSNKEWTYSDCLKQMSRSGLCMIMTSPENVAGVVGVLVGPSPAPARRRGVVRVRPGPFIAGAVRSESVSPSRISQQVAYIALNIGYGENSKSTDLTRPAAVVGRDPAPLRRPSQARPGPSRRRQVSQSESNQSASCMHSIKHELKH